VNVEPPSFKYFVTTIEYLYTGMFPASARECSDVFFGLLANGHYLSCDRLVKRCLMHLDAVLKGDGYKVFTSHSGFNSRLVPSDLVKRLACPPQEYDTWSNVRKASTATKPKRDFKAVDIMLDWLDKETEATKEGKSMAAECERILSSNDFTRDEYTRLFSNLRASAAYPWVLTKGQERIFNRVEW
jgi:hypothetical protein